MSNQSAINLFLILAIMSVTLFFHQMARLDYLERQPVINVPQIGSLDINQNQFESLNRSFEQAKANYHQAVKNKNTSDFLRKTFDLLTAPVHWLFDLFLDKVTDIEDEADNTITVASSAMNQYQTAIQSAFVTIKRYQETLENTRGEISQGRHQQIDYTRSLRNCALLLFLFSLGAAMFARPTRIDTTQVDWLPAERPEALKQALGLSGMGGVLSSLPGLDGILFQLVLPSLCIGYFIIRRQLPLQRGDWKKTAVGGFGFGLMVSIAILTLYAWFGLSITFAVSGFLFGLFIAAAIQCVSLPLTTRQFFLVALIFGVTRLLAYLSAANAGAELTVLEGIIGIIAVLWVIQTHASWVRLIRFDILLVWFSVYSAVAFGLGNYFEAGFPQLLGSYFTTALAGGGLLTYYLSQARMEKEVLLKLPNLETPMLLVSKKQLVS